MSVVGIDLGTTNTVVGCVRTGKVHVLADEKGARLLPSVVSFHPNGEVLVGAAAKARRVIDARNTVYSHKRLIGRSWSSPEITQARQRFAFELREGPGQGPLVHARGQDYTLPEISAFVLKRTRQIAEQALGTPVERAVITVPAHFNELQRASTKVAGRVSGLEVLRILNEPTAAALAYGLGRTGSERVAVYDFGGGTFDCTLLDLNGNVFEVLATAGDSFLGGDDIDNMIADRMAEAFLKEYRLDPKQDAQMYERLKTTAEDIKIALSNAETATAAIKDFAHGAGGSTISFTFTMTRKDLDAMVTPLVDRSFKVTQDALTLARLSPTSFDKVILVGGSTRMPVIRKRVEGFFGRAPMDRVNPDEVVAIGAAIQAAALTEGVRKRSIPAPPQVLGRGSQSEALENTQTTEVGAPKRPTFGSDPGAFGFASSVGPQPGSHVGFASTLGSGTVGGTAPMGRPLAPKPSPPGPSEPDPMTGLSVPTPFEWVPPGSAQTQARGPAASERTFGADPPTLPQRGGFDAPAGGLPDDGPFGAVPDLSLVSTTGVTAPGVPSSEGGFGHVSDLSLIDAQGGPGGFAPTGEKGPGGFAPTGEKGPGGFAPTGEKGASAAAAAIARARAPQADDEPETASLMQRADLPAAAAKAPARPPPTGTPDDARTRTAAMRPAPGGKVPPAIVRRESEKMPTAAKGPHGVGPRPGPPPVPPRPPPVPTNRPPVGSAPGNVTSVMPAAPPPPLQSTNPYASSPPQVTPFGRASQPSSPAHFAQPPPRGSYPSAPHPSSPSAPPHPAPYARPQSAPPAPFPSSPSAPPPAPFPSSPSAPPHAPAPYASSQGAFQGPYPPAPQAGYPPPAGPPFAFGSAPPPGGAPFGSVPPAGQPSPYGSPPAGPPFAFGSAPPPDGAQQMMAAFGPDMAPTPEQVPRAPAAPVLVDVTPRALVVETAGGYTDTIIPRNSKIPCERTRRFATGRDLQTSVRVRVAQGENPMFPQNTYLGEVELSGLRPAARGEVTVAVTFEVDADGTLRVRARDVQTGQEARATLQLIGVADESSVVMMINRFARQSIIGSG